MSALLVVFSSRYLTGKLFFCFFEGGFLLVKRDTFCGNFYVQYFICCHSDYTVSEDAGIEPGTVATLALAVRRSNHSARSHPTRAISHPTDFLWHVYKKKDDVRAFDG